MKTLRELKKRYPDKIRTYGRTYHIEGIGTYYQITENGCVSTYEQYEDLYGDTAYRWCNFDKLVAYLKMVWE